MPVAFPSAEGFGEDSIGGRGGVVFLVDLTIADNVFNEIYPALPVSGTVIRTALPTIGISPGTGNLKVGDQLQFTVTGSPVRRTTRILMGCTELLIVRPLGKSATIFRACSR